MINTAPFIPSAYCWARWWRKFPLLYSNKTGRRDRAADSKRIHCQIGKVRKHEQLIVVFLWFSADRWPRRRWKLSLCGASWFGKRRGSEKSKKLYRQNSKVCVVLYSWLWERPPQQAMCYFHSFHKIVDDCRFTYLCHGFLKLLFKQTCFSFK